MAFIESHPRSSFLQLDFFKLLTGGFRSDPVTDDRQTPQERGRKERNCRSIMRDAPSDEIRRDERRNTAAADHDAEARRPQARAEELAEIRITNAPQPPQHANHDGAENKEGLE